MKTSITPAVARHQLSVVSSCCTVFDRVVSLREIGLLPLGAYGASILTPSAPRFRNLVC